MAKQRKPADAPPSDPNQWAAWMVSRMTSRPGEKNPAAVALGKLGGKVQPAAGVQAPVFSDTVIEVEPVDISDRALHPD